MVVKNILKKVSQLLNLNDVLDSLNSDNFESNTQILEEINLMMLSVNIVNNNIASNYIELFDKIKINCSDEIIPFDKISNYSIIEIKKVLSGNTFIPFKVLPNGLKVSKNGVFEIIYTYFPATVEINDSINYYTRVNELIFSQGVVGEYLFLKGSIEDAYMWDKKFKQSLLNLLRPKRKCFMPARRWY